MKVQEIMSRDPYVCSPRTTLIDVATHMREMDVGMIPVGEGDDIRGMITDRDITIRAVVQGLDPAMTLAEQIMSEDVAYCYQDQEVSEAAALMEQKQIRRLIVMDREKHLVGVISLGDIAAKGSNDERCGAALHAISQPTPAPPVLPSQI